MIEVRGMSYALCVCLVLNDERAILAEVTSCQPAAICCSHRSVPSSKSSVMFLLHLIFGKRANLVEDPLDIFHNIIECCTV